jgi:apolipoprotein D and lipocalin family protein
MKVATAIIAAVAFAKTTPLCSDARAKCDAVDLPKYLGNWFEIGRSFIIRNTFERGCDCVEAKYKLNPDNKNVEVTNTCVRRGEFTEIVGNAEPLSPSEFRVSFNPGGAGGAIASFFQSLARGPNYVVKNVWLDEQGNYQRALVVAPQRRIPFGRFLDSIWILARTPSITDAEIQETLEYARAAGYEPEKARWEKTEQVTCRK